MMSIETLPTLLWQALCSFPLTRPKICFQIPASPTDNFYSQIAMFNLALEALGGIYKQAHIIVTLGDNEITPFPDKWKPYWGNNVKLYWVNPELYQQHHYFAQVDARWKYDHDEYDFIIFCDADTILIKPIDDLLIKLWQFPAAMGVIAHYPFPMTSGGNNSQLWLELAKQFTGKPIEFHHRYSLISYSDLPKSENCPFYVNFGFVITTSQIANIIRDTYSTIRLNITPLTKYFSGQVALTLALLAHDIPTRALGLRYNFPNDPLADRLHPKELEDIRLLHYLRTNKFDRQKIFTNERSFMDFLSLKLEGSNQVFQNYIRKLTNGKYPF